MDKDISLTLLPSGVTCLMGDTLYRAIALADLRVHVTQAGVFAEPQGQLVSGLVLVVNKSGEMLTLPLVEVTFPELSVTRA